MPLPKLPTVLRGKSLLISGASALCAYPAAADLVGTGLGVLAVGAVSSVSMYCWHYAGTQTGNDEISWAHRIGAGAVATLCAGIIMKGIVVSADLNQRSKAIQASAPASELYQKQEITRLALVETLSRKLEATDNRKDPKDYKRLSEQLDAAMIPTEKPADKTQQYGLVIPVEYKWAIAGTLEGSIPVLMILAGLFEARRRKDEENSQLPKVARQDNSGQQQGNSGTTAENPDDDPDPMEMFSNKLVPLNEAGAVTIQSIVAASGKSPKLARALRDQAAEEGWLYATGNGNAKSYWYWDYIQPEEQLSLLRRVK